MKKRAALCVLILLFAFLNGHAPGDADSPAITEFRKNADGSFSCSFDGVKHTFLLELPEKGEGAPLILMLPGYGNTAEAFRLDTHLEKEANALGYAVAYVTGAPDPNSPTSSIGWNSETTTGNRDVEFLVSLAKTLQETYSLDATRSYAVGFSNGAFMTHRLAMEAGDTFSALVSVAGLMPKSIWDARRETSNVSFFQITGEKDPVVPKNSDGSAGFASNPAIEDVMDYWAESNGLELTETIPIGKASTLTKYESEGSTRQVWHLFIKNGRHSWPQEGIHQININALILEFLETQK